MVWLNPKTFIDSAIQKIDANPQIKKTMEDLVEKADFKMEVGEESFLEIVNKDALKNKVYSKTKKDGREYFCFTAEFDDIRKLFQGKREIAIIEDKDGLVTYTEYFSPQAADKTNGTDPAVFKGCTFKYILHLPRDIIKANTVKIDKNTATWELPFEEVIANKDFHITATMKSENKISRWLKNIIKKK